LRKAIAINKNAGGSLRDAISIGINVDAVVGNGIDATVGKLRVLTGKDKGETKWFGDAGGAIGLNVGISWAMSEYYYLDPTFSRPHGIGNFAGARLSGGFDLSYGFLDAGYGGSVAPVYPQDGIYMIGITRQVGLGIPGPLVSGDINWGRTWLYEKK
jgi:hypothetical protein